MYESTDLTPIPLSINNLDVPPVDKISMPSFESARAKSTIPDLSDTLISTRVTGIDPIISSQYIMYYSN